MRSQSLTGLQHMQLNYLYGWVRETLSILVLVLIVNYLYDIMNEKSKPPLKRDRSTSDEALDLSMTDFLSGPSKLSPEKSKSFSDHNEGKYSDMNKESFNSDLYSPISSPIKARESENASRSFTDLNATLPSRPGIKSPSKAEYSKIKRKWEPLFPEGDITPSKKKSKLHRTASRAAQSIKDNIIGISKTIRRKSQKERSMRPLAQRCNTQRQGESTSPNSINSPPLGLNDTLDANLLDIKLTTSEDSPGTDISKKTVREYDEDSALESEQDLVIDDRNIPIVDITNTIDDDETTRSTVIVHKEKEKQNEKVSTNPSNILFSRRIIMDTIEEKTTAEYTTLDKEHIYQQILTSLEEKCKQAGITDKTVRNTFLNKIVTKPRDHEMLSTSLSTFGTRGAVGGSIQTNSITSIQPPGKDLIAQVELFTRIREHSGRSARMEHVQRNIVQTMIPCFNHVMETRNLPNEDLRLPCKHLTAALFIRQTPTPIDHLMRRCAHSFINEKDRFNFQKDHFNPRNLKGPEANLRPIHILTFLLGHTANYTPDLMILMEIKTKQMEIHQRVHRRQDEEALIFDKMLSTTPGTFALEENMRIILSLAVTQYTASSRLRSCRLCRISPVDGEHVHRFHENIFSQLQKADIIHLITNSVPQAYCTDKKCRKVFANYATAYVHVMTKKHEVHCVKCVCTGKNDIRSVVQSGNHFLKHGFYCPAHTCKNIFTRGAEQFARHIVNHDSSTLKVTYDEMSDRALKRFLIIYNIIPPVHGLSKLYSTPASLAIEMSDIMASPVLDIALGLEKALAPGKTNPLFTTKLEINNLKVQKAITRLVPCKLYPGDTNFISKSERNIVNGNLRSLTTLITTSFTSGVNPAPAFVLKMNVEGLDEQRHDLGVLREDYHLEKGTSNSEVVKRVVQKLSNKSFVIIELVPKYTHGESRDETRLSLSHQMTFVRHILLTMENPPMAAVFVRPPPKWLYDENEFMTTMCATERWTSILSRNAQIPMIPIVGFVMKHRVDLRRVEPDFVEKVPYFNAKGNHRFSSYSTENFYSIITKLQCLLGEMDTIEVD